MASEWNRALRTLKRVAEARIKSLPDVETSYHDYSPHPLVPGLRAAISEIDALIEPEEDDR